jgi:hypothetical protein
MNIFKGLKLLRQQQSKRHEKPLNKMTYSELCERAAELYEDAFEGDEDAYWNID